MKQNTLFHGNYFWAKNLPTHVITPRAQPNERQVFSLLSKSEFMGEVKHAK